MQWSRDHSIKVRVRCESPTSIPDLIKYELVTLWGERLREMLSVRIIVPKSSDRIQNSAAVNLLEPKSTISYGDMIQQGSS